MTATRYANNLQLYRVNTPQFLFYFYFFPLSPFVVTVCTVLLETGEWRWGKREIIYLSLHGHHQNDSCIKMGSDESHFNASLIVRDSVHKSQPFYAEKGEPKRNRGEAFLLTSLTLYL